MATRVASRRRPRERHAHSDLGLFLRHIDYLLLAAVGAAIAFGIWVLGSVTQTDVPGDPEYYVVRQLIYVAVGALALAIVIAINPEVYRRLGATFFVLSVVLIAAVFAFGEDVRGSRRWIELGFFQFQPSELGKVLLTLFLASFLAGRMRRIGEARTVISAVALLAVPMILVFEQPDFGTALVFGAGLAAALFLAGIRWLHLALLSIVAALVAMALLWFLPAGGVQILEPYQIDRLVGFVHPDADPSGTTYNVNQSITAVGSGGLDGRGVAGATQTNLNYLPEHATDFIFSSLAEQRGFLGASLLLLLYALIVWRGVKIVAIAPTLYTAVVAGSLVFSFLFQVFINVGMTVGIAPITGIPLPFVSAGGSSLITTMIMIGLLEAIHVRGRLAGRR
jgi:rod shape determining protein RodA